MHAKCERQDVCMMLLNAMTSQIIKSGTHQHWMATLRRHAVTLTPEQGQSELVHQTDEPHLVSGPGPYTLNHKLVHQFSESHLVSGPEA